MKAPTNTSLFELVPILFGSWDTSFLLLKKGFPFGRLSPSTLLLPVAAVTYSGCSLLPWAVVTQQCFCPPWSSFKQANQEKYFLSLWFLLENSLGPITQFQSHFNKAAKKLLKEAVNSPLLFSHRFLQGRYPNAGICSPIYIFIYTLPCTSS